MDLSPVTAAAASAAVRGVGQAAATWDTSHLMALAAALGWASGLRLYAVVFLTGLAGRLGWVPLPDGLLLLQQPLVLGVAGVLLVVEFLADKIPWVDSAWDAVHTLIRIPAGAALAAGVVGADAGQWPLIAALPRNPALSLPERHLGLVQAQELPHLHELLDGWADAWDAALHPGMVIPPVQFSHEPEPPLPPLLAGRRIAIARSEEHV